MPTYCYKREDTGEVVERTFMAIPDDETRRRIVCDDGVVATRFLAAEGDGERKAVYGRWPMMSAACGVNPKQVDAKTRRYADRAKRKRFPHHKFDPRTGRMQFDSRQHRRRCLKDMGMVDQHSFTGY